MLTEGWDVKNVFQIYPHEKRAFNSKLLIAQVLGRGLRRPEGLKAEPRVFVFNHDKWGGEVEDLVAEVLDQETTIAQRPTDERPVKHFDLHQLDLHRGPDRHRGEGGREAEGDQEADAATPGRCRGVGRVGLRDRLGEASDDSHARQEHVLPAGAVVSRGAPADEDTR